MDYATNPVQVTPAPQPSTAGPRGASPPGSESPGFNGLLQNATSATANNASTHGDNSGDNASGAGNAEGVRPQATGIATEPGSNSGIRTSLSPTGESESIDITGKSGNSLLFSGMVAIPEAITDAQNRSKVTLPAELADGVASDGTDVNILQDNVLNSADLSGDTGTKPGTHGEQPSRAVVVVPTTNGEVVGDRDPDALLLNGLSDDAKGRIPKSGDSLHGALMGATNGSALPSVAGEMHPRASELKVITPQYMTSASMNVGISDDPSNAASASGTAPGTSEALAKADSVLPTPLLQGGNRSQSIADTIALAHSRQAVVTSPDAATDLRVKTMPSTVELSSPQVSGVAVSSSIAATGIAQGIVSRHRNGAANDDSVSQIARGGNEARLVELNSARAANAVSPGNAVVSTVVETKTELEAKHTNAVTLAAISDEKALRTSMPVAGQQQLATRMGGIDITQTGSVDFAVTQVDSTPASQSVTRVAILEPGWTSQLGTDLRSLVARGPSTTQVHVTPAELGPLDIEMSVNRQEVSVRILAMHGQTRQMLEAALPRLREALGQSYASVDVSVGNGSGHSASNNQNQHCGGQAGTMTMMSDGQDGLNDSTQLHDSGLAEGTQGDDESNGLPADDTNTQQNGSAVANKPKPARGLVDAYA